MSVWSLNLLPKDERERLQGLNRERRWSWALLGCVLLVVFQYAAVFSTNRYLEKRAASLERTLESMRRSTARANAVQLNDLIKIINGELRTLTPYAKDRQVDELLPRLLTAFPQSFEMQNISLDIVDRKLTFSGSAQVRNDVPKLQEALSQVSFLKDASIHADLNQRSDISVSGSATLMNLPATP